MIWENDSPLSPDSHNWRIEATCAILPHHMVRGGLHDGDDRGIATHSFRLVHVSQKLPLSYSRILVGNPLHSCGIPSDSSSHRFHDVFPFPAVEFSTCERPSHSVLHGSARLGTQRWLRGTRARHRVGFAPPASWPLTHVSLIQCVTVRALNAWTFIFFSVSRNRRESIQS